jgi:hypothetical protein
VSGRSRSEAARTRPQYRQGALKVGVVSSTTGPVALAGIPQKNTVPLLPARVGGLEVEYIPLDDASDPTASVTAVKKLIAEHEVDAIIGPSGSANAMAVNRRIGITSSPRANIAARKEKSPYPQNLWINLGARCQHRPQSRAAKAFAPPCCKDGQNSIHLFSQVFVKIP